MVIVCTTNCTAGCIFAPAHTDKHTQARIHTKPHFRKHHRKLIKGVAPIAKHAQTHIQRQRPIQRPEDCSFHARAWHKSQSHRQVHFLYHLSISRPPVMERLAVPRSATIVSVAFGHQEELQKCFCLIVPLN